MDQVDPRHRLRRRPGQQFRGVAGVEADVADVERFDLRQDLRHAVDIRLAADEPDARKSLRFGDQVFATAESDFEPDIVDLTLEQFGEIGRRGAAADIERQMRQQIVDQVGLVIAELVTLPAAEERAACMRRRAVVWRHVLIVGLVMGGDHRSVWYSRCSSRARGSIDEMYSCS